MLLRIFFFFLYKKICFTSVFLKSLQTLWRRAWLKIIFGRWQKMLWLQMSEIWHALEFLSVIHKGNKTALIFSEKKTEIPQNYLAYPFGKKQRRARQDNIPAGDLFSRLFFLQNTRSIRFKSQSLCVSSEAILQKLLL